MNNFILKILKFISVPILLYILLYLLLSLKKVNGSYLATLYNFKLEKLEKYKEQKKIIIIGGSNGKFCYYSPILKKYFPEYEIINASLQGNVGLMHSLDYIKPYLRKDDIVILSPEYAMLQTESGLYGNYQSVHLLSVYNGIMKKNISDFNHLKSFVSQTIMHVRAFLEIFVIQYIMKKEGGTDKFIKKHHNEFGDIVHAKGKIHYVSFPIAIDTNFTENAIDFLNEYNNYCKVKQTKLFINFPAVAKQSITTQIDDSLFIQFYNRHLIAIPHLNKPSEVIADKSHFFDSPYHLRENEQHEHTKKLCEKLKMYLY